MSKNKVKLTASQIYAIEYVKRNNRVFVAFNSHLHKATVDALVKYKILQRIGTGYVELTDFGKTFKL